MPAAREFSARLLLFFLVIPSAPGLRSAPAASVQPGALYSALCGSWTGSLEYRDFQNDKRVTLPTTLEATLTEDRSSVQLAYTYDDGPGKIVKEKALIRVPAAGDRYIVKDEDGSETAYQIASATGFRGAEGGKLVLSGPGTENKKPVEVRTTLEVGPASLSILRETRPAGEEFKFRHEYRFKRTGERKP